MISVAARYAKAVLILLSSAGAAGAAHAQAPAYPSKSIRRIVESIHRRSQGGSPGHRKRCTIGLMFTPRPLPTPERGRAARV